VTSQEQAPGNPPAGEQAAVRRRGAALEAALLDAAWDELQAVGYARLTLEAVAERAGTSRPVLARRWGSRPELVIAALRRHRPMLSGQVPDTGSLRGDVLALLRRASAVLREIGPEVISGLLTDRLAIDSLPRIQADVFQVGTGAMAAILRNAAERGEIQGGIPPRVVTLPTDLFRHEVFIIQSPPEDQAIIEIVDDVFLPRVLAQATQQDTGQPGVRRAGGRPGQP
jgi:AcrR family transcriptional regulator